MIDKNKFRWGMPNEEMRPLEVNGIVSLTEDLPSRGDFPTVFRPQTTKKYKVIDDKRFRIPRKEKKKIKKRFCEKGLIVKKLHFSYVRLNRQNYD